MPYTARQLQSLNALGLVPWVVKNSASSQPESATTIVPVSDSTAVAAGNGISSTEPLDLDELGAWLSEQALAQFTYRSKTLDRIGKEDAPVLLIMDELPLPDSQGRLLNDMLRAIELDPRDACLVCLDVAESLVPTATVQSVTHAGTRAVLYFSDLHVSAQPHYTSAFKFDSRCAWCLPTLKKLQQQPQLKRQAWNSLKELQGALAG